MILTFFNPNSKCILSFSFKANIGYNTNDDIRLQGIKCHALHDECGRYFFFLLCVLLFHTNSNIFVNVFYVHLPLSCVAHYVAHTFADMDRERERERVNEKNEDLLGAVFTPIVISFGLLLFTFFFHPRCI